MSTVALPIGCEPEFFRLKQQALRDALLLFDRNVARTRPEITSPAVFAFLISLFAPDAPQRDASEVSANFKWKSKQVGNQMRRFMEAEDR